MDPLILKALAGCVVVGLLIGLAVVAGMRASNRHMDQTWGRFARRHGLTLSGDVTSGVRNMPLMAGRFHDLPLTVDAAWSNAHLPVWHQFWNHLTSSDPRLFRPRLPAGTVWTRVRIALPEPQPRHLCVWPQGWREDLALALGLREARIGDADFDRRYVIETDDPDLARIALNPKVRAGLRQFGRVVLQVDREGVELRVLGWRHSAARLENLARVAHFVAERVSRRIPDDGPSALDLAGNQPAMQWATRLAMVPMVLGLVYLGYWLWRQRQAAYDRNAETFRRIAERQEQLEREALARQMPALAAEPGLKDLPPREVAELGLDIEGLGLWLMQLTSLRHHAASQTALRWHIGQMIGAAERAGIGPARLAEMVRATTVGSSFEAVLGEGLSVEQALAQCRPEQLPQPPRAPDGSLPLLQDLALQIITGADYGDRPTQPAALAETIAEGYRRLADRCGLDRKAVDELLRYRSLPRDRLYQLKVIEALARDTPR